MKSPLSLLIVTLLFADFTAALADATKAMPVGRSTDDRDHDLIAAMVGLERFDEALRICQTQTERADPTTDAAARWVIRHSDVLVAKSLSGQQFSESEIAIASKPVSELLAAHPKHTHAVFLTAQLVRVKMKAAMFQLVQASISPDQQVRLSASKQLVAVQAVLKKQMKTVADQQSELRHQSNPISGIDADLQRLQQSLHVDSVSLSLAQTELYAPGSDDRVAAAAVAEQAAQEAVKRIGNDTPAHTELQRLRIVAILRAGQPPRALSLFDDVFQSHQNKRAPRLLALQIQILVAMGKAKQAEDSLSDFFGEDPRAAPRSIDMDLVRLEYLLRFQPDQVAGWFDAIERRGGRYARRRAEAIAISMAYRDQSGSSANPALLAASGRDWLRRGNALRAAELLAAAALAEQDDDRSIRQATEAAAAFTKAGEATRAAQVLIKTSNGHPQAATAPAAHLQAIYLLRSSGPKEIETLLRRQLRQWPDATVADSASAWLSKHLTGQGRYLEAAQLVSDVDAADLTVDRVASIAAAWRTAFHEASGTGLEIESRQFLKSMMPLLESPLVKEGYRELASMLLDRDFLAGLPDGLPENAFVAALIQFRKGGVLAKELESLPRDDAADVRWRLIRDGRALPQLRPSIAKLIQKWQSEPEPTFEKAELAFWSGGSTEAIRILQQLVKSSQGDLDVLKRAAILLASVDNVDASIEAIEHWDQIAAGTPKGSPLWHEAKLAAIALLRRNGNHDAAIKRAKYILLTMPNMAQQYKQAYQSVTP